MCEPVIVGAAIAATSAAIKIGTSIRAANTEEKIAQNNAAMANLQQGLVKQEGTNEAARIEAQGRAAASSALAIGQANGIETPAAGITSLYNAQADAMAVRANAARRAWGIQNEAQDMLTQAKINRKAAALTGFATGLDAAMPLWVQDGGLEAWIARLKDPAIRARVIAEMRNPHPADWENLYGAAGAGGTLLLEFKNPKLKPLTGKSLAEVAKMRGVSPEDVAVDLVIEDGSRVGIAYFLMSEDNIRRQVALPWVSFGSDEAGDAPEGVFLLSAAHPRAYGNFARVFAQYVRHDHVLSMEQAVRKLATLPADNLSLPDRGRLKIGAYADVAVFDPDTIQDHATYDHPHQLSSGMKFVIVNGKFALKDGVATGAATGRVVRGRAWTGAPDGGCRKSAGEWSWTTN